jgi:single-strand DNA-binding protein
LWRGLAEIAQRFLHKGDLVYVEGKLRTRSWEKEGVTRYTTEIVGDNMTMLSSRGGSGGGSNEMSTSSSERSQETFRAPADNSTDDLPF